MVRWHSGTGRHVHILESRHLDGQWQGTPACTNVPNRPRSWRNVDCPRSSREIASSGRFSLTRSSASISWASDGCVGVALPVRHAGCAPEAKESGRAGCPAPEHRHGRAVLGLARWLMGPGRPCCFRLAECLCALPDACPGRSRDNHPPPGNGGCLATPCRCATVAVRHRDQYVFGHWRRGIVTELVDDVGKYLRVHARCHQRRLPYQGYQTSPRTDVLTGAAVRMAFSFWSSHRQSVLPLVRPCHRYCKSGHHQQGQATSPCAP